MELEEGSLIDRDRFSNGEPENEKICYVPFGTEFYVEWNLLIKVKH